MRQMMQNNAHTAAAASAEAMFSCANIALLTDTMILVSVSVILISLLGLLGLIRLSMILAAISMIILPITIPCRKT